MPTSKADDNVVDKPSKDERLKQLRALAKKTNTDYAKKGGVENARVGGKKELMFFAKDMELHTTLLGLPHIDVLMGGVPQGRMVVDYGPTGAGKSSFNYWVIGILQRLDKICCVVNIEGGFDPVWAEKCGVILEELIIIDAGATFEETAQKMSDALQTHLIDHFLVDSIQGQLTEKETYKSSGNNQRGATRDIKDDAPGALPQKVGALLRRLTPIFGKSSCSMTIIGQARDSFDMYVGMTLTGGHALKHAARRICRWQRASKKEWPTEGDKVVGFTARVTMEIQQLNAHEGEFFLFPFKKDQGVHTAKLYVDAGVDAGIIEAAAGSYWTWKNKEGKPVKVNGMPATYRYFKENPDEFEDLQQKLNEAAIVNTDDS